MESADIKAAIEKAGTSQTAIARYLGLTPNTVNRVVQKTGRSARVEAELAKICGRPIHAHPGKHGQPKTVWNGVLAA